MDMDERQNEVRRETEKGQVLSNVNGTSVDVCQNIFIHWLSAHVYVYVYTS